MDLIPVKLAAARLGLSTGYVRTLCRQQRIPGAVLDGRRWLVPDDARVRRKSSGLLTLDADAAALELRRSAELETRMRRLAAALATEPESTVIDKAGSGDS